MDFAPNETQLLLRDQAGRLLRDKYRFEQRKQFIEAPGAIWADFAALGLLGIETPEIYGGSGGEFHDVAAVLEAFGKALVVEPFIPTVVLGGWLIQHAGNEAQRHEVLPKMADGTLHLALADERNNVRPTRDADGWRLDGDARGVLGGDAAGMVIVPASTEAGLALFLVPTEGSGVQRRAYRNVDGTRAADFFFEAVHLHDAALLGAPGKGAGPLEHARDRAAAAVCCEAVGILDALNALTLDYLKTRVQFGRPIGKFQVLQHRMADMLMAAEKARSMAILASDHADDTDASRRARAISASKVAIGRAVTKVGQGAIQLHGGIGLTMEYIASHYFKRLTAIELSFGGTEHHLERYANLQRDA